MMGFQETPARLFVRIVGAGSLSAAGREMGLALSVDARASGRSAPDGP